MIYDMALPSGCYPILFFTSYLVIFCTHTTGVSDNFKTVDHSHMSVQEGLPRLHDSDSVVQGTTGHTAIHTENKFEDPNLHPEHYPYYFTQHPDQAEICRQDDSCTHKDALDKRACWGYEVGCDRQNLTTYPHCLKHHPGWAQSIDIQQNIFWNQTDFGYLKNMREGHAQLCIPKTEPSSSLDCSPQMHFCRAKNLVFNFTQLDPPTSYERYKALPNGYVSGDCTMNRDILEQYSQHKGDLQSWVKEIGNISEVSTGRREKLQSQCGVVLDKPTFIMKLDAGVNMYHHFCDFVNLYLSQLYNQSYSSDIYIIMWDTSGMYYGDFFSETWQAFSDHPIIPLKDMAGETVCLQDGVFSTLPRMPRGFFYNMPMVPDCTGSSFMRSFSQHVVHRLGIKQQGPVRDKLRITFLDRNSTFRNVINQKELIDELKKNSGYDVKVVVYNLKDLTFVQQIEITHNSDIFISMHGAGLTHLLFLPDWAVVFELSNCEDERCYLDLARLRGVHYTTWREKHLLQKHNETPHPSLGTPHAKFCDYSFNKEEFIRLVEEAAHHVRSHPKYIPKNIHDEL